MEMNIALLPGDGIGPEVMEEAVRVTRVVARRYGHKVEFAGGLVGAAAIDKTGNPYPDETHRLCMNADAVLFGAIGHPRYDSNPRAEVRPEQGLLAMRKKLGLFANLRPVFTFASLMDQSPLKNHLLKQVDFLVVRELIGGIYFGQPSGRSEDGGTAFDTCLYTREEIERIVDLAFGFAMERKHRLTLVDKANVLATSRLWREVTMEVSKRYPGVDTDYLFVDNAAMQIILNPSRFDVLVTENMFGDILTDEASVIAGSLGLLPSASIGLHTSVFEPIHGSYPQAAGKNIANPLAMILSVAMMFEYGFQMKDEAGLIRAAVEASVNERVGTPDIARGKTCSTRDVGEWIAGYIDNA
ncbi:MAG TPA: 3-isopropylmalate dehydrogenase [Bacteroidetes bacterium]|nr:3-isopropylmalate dehydrogenase [Bacteroidota bacterium]